jgi:uncharacterized protein
MKLICYLFAFLVTLFWSTIAWSQTALTSPSFNCNVVLNQIEQSICNSSSLASLDRRVSKLYKSVREAKGPIEQNEIKSSQRNWLKQRNLACGDYVQDKQRLTDCVELHYLRRISQLENINLDVLTTSSKTSDVGNEKEASSALVPLASRESKLKSLADALSGMMYDEKVSYMSAKLEAKGYFTPYGYVYSRYPDALPKGREIVLTGFKNALTCMEELNVRADKMSKVCLAPKGTQSTTARRQPTFKIEWFEDNPTCHSIQAYFLADEKMLITKRDVGFAGWSDTDGEVKVTAPNSRGGYHTYIYDKKTNTGEFLRKESIPTQYETCMDTADYEASK